MHVMLHSPLWCWLPLLSNVQPTGMKNSFSPIQRAPAGSTLWFAQEICCFAVCCLQCRCAQPFYRRRGSRLLRWWQIVSGFCHLAEMGHFGCDIWTMPVTNSHVPIPLSHMQWLFGGLTLICILDTGAKVFVVESCWAPLWGEARATPCQKEPPPVAHHGAWMGPAAEMVAPQGKHVYLRAKKCLTAAVRVRKWESQPCRPQGQWRRRAGGAPDARAAVPLLPVERPQVEQAVPLRPTGYHSRADLHVVPCGWACARAGGLPGEAAAHADAEAGSM